MEEEREAVSERNNAGGIGRKRNKDKRGVRQRREEE